MRAGSSRANCTFERCGLLFTISAELGLDVGLQATTPFSYISPSRHSETQIDYTPPNTVRPCQPRPPRRVISLRETGEEVQPILRALGERRRDEEEKFRTGATTNREPRRLSDGRDCPFGEAVYQGAG